MKFRLSDKFTKKYFCMKYPRCVLNDESMKSKGGEWLRLMYAYIYGGCFVYILENYPKFSAHSFFAFAYKTLRNCRNFCAKLVGIVFFFYTFAIGDESMKPWLHDVSFGLMRMEWKPTGEGWGRNPNELDGWTHKEIDTHAEKGKTSVQRLSAKMLNGKHDIPGKFWLASPTATESTHFTIKQYAAAATTKKYRWDKLRCSQSGKATVQNIDCGQRCQCHTYIVCRL